METIQPNHNVDLFHDIVALSDYLFRPGITAEESHSMYEKWASLGTYDKLNKEAKYFNAHDKLMEGVLQLFPERRDIRILDIGAGTGLIGERLHAEGFTNLDALDPSQQMLKAAEKKGVYKNYICSFFTEKIIDCIENDTYDLLLLCGVFGPGEVPVDAFTEAIRIAKPGAHIVTCVRAEYIETYPEYKDKWGPFVSGLISEGKMKLVAELRYPTHYFHYDGFRFIYRIL